VNCYPQDDFIDFTLDSNKNDIELRLLDKLGRPLGSFNRLKKELEGEGKKLIFAMNAGIYMQDQMPLGLYIENGKILRKLNTRKNLYGNFYLQPNGVFLISEGKPYIIETGSFHTFSKSHKVQYATQSGPLLLINGEYNNPLRKYDKNKFIRNAVCLTPKDEVSLTISKKPVNFTEMGEHLRVDLRCRSALYLDGAISGIYQMNDFLKNNPPYGGLIAVTLAKLN
jgi:uncharacterized protein YigE (DUF2233 family)